MWAAQFYRWRRPRQMITSGGLGTMGFGLPAAIGAQFGRPGQDRHRHRRRRQLPDDHATSWPRPPSTTSRSRSSILNNDFQGMVRQWQELFYEKRYFGHADDATPDFAKVAEAFGATGISVHAQGPGPRRHRADARRARPGA